MNEAVIKNMLENEDIRKGAYSFIGDTNITYADINILIQQLATYKQKEDKLREELLIWGEVINPTLQNNLLQILNEGIDKNE